jgi:hypothetical protein
MFYVVKAAISDEHAKRFSFPAQKTMYGGKNIAVKDEIFVFSSENQGGQGLLARCGDIGREAACQARSQGPDHPRVSIGVRRVASAKRSLWDDARPETELCFKIYRQATNKVAGITEGTAKFLRTHF